jgi:hypothetical protein
VTWLAWRQFRAQAAAGAAAVAASAILLATAGPHLAGVYAGRRAAPGRRVRRPQGRRLPRRQLRAADGQLPQRAGPGPEHHPGLAAGRQARADRPDRHGGHRRAQPHVRLVGSTHRPGGPARDGQHPDWRPVQPRSFDALGIAPVGYAAFTFVVGVTVGLLIRRVVPAMTVALTLRRWDRTRLLREGMAMEFGDMPPLLAWAATPAATGGWRDVLLPPGSPWLVRVARATDGRPALEVYAAGSLIDVVVAPSLGCRLVRGACSAVVARKSCAIAWGCLPVTGSPPPDVEFIRGRFRRRPQPAKTDSVAGWFWFATAGGRFSRVAAVSDGTRESCRVLAVGRC